VLWHNEQIVVPFVSGTGNYKRKREKRSKEIRQREKDKLEQAKNVYLSIKQLHLQELNQSWTLYFSLSLSLSLPDTTNRSVKNKYLMLR